MKQLALIALLLVGFSVTQAQDSFNLIRGAKNIENFGARGWIASGNTVDSTAAIQAALSLGGDVYVPPTAPGDYYRITSTLTITKPTRLYGEGINSRIAIASTFSTSSDAILITPIVAGSENTHFFYRLDRFTLTTESSAAARDGVRIDLTAFAGTHVGFDMDRVWVSPSSGYNLRLVNPTNNDGFVFPVIRGCAFQGGGLGAVFMQRLGDSAVFRDNIFSGAGPGLELSFTNGAAQIVIEKNNITSLGGGIILHNGQQVKIVENQIEQNGVYTGAEVASVVLKGDTAQIGDSEIHSNNINTLGYLTYAIDVQGATDTSIANNVLVSASHVRVGASAVRTKVSANNTFKNASYVVVAPVVLNNGTATVADFHVPKYFSIAPSLVGFDPRLGIRDRNDSISLGMRMRRTATNVGGYAEIGVDNEEFGTTSLYGHGLKFYTNQSDGALNTSLQLEADGKVRIGGTTALTPLAQLHVRGQAGAGSVLVVDSYDATASNHPIIKFRNGSGNTDILTVGSVSSSGESWINSFGAVHIGTGSTVFESNEKARFPGTGGMQLLTGTRPTCNATNRGSLFYVAGGAGVADSFEACRKDISDVYAWVTIY
ncbi:MAG: NosD domain-containing protein [Pyrinomonadaceae bacterium]